MIALLGSGFVTLRRIIIQRADVATFDQRELAPGELVYLVNTDGSITLRVGDGIVADGRIPYDPAASRIIVRRVLDPVSEYYIEAYGGAIANADQSYVINADNVSTAGIRIVSIRDPIASVTYDNTPSNLGDMTVDVDAAPYNDQLVDLSTNVITLTATTATSMYISNIVVTAWSDRRAIGATNDMRETTVFADSPTTRDNPTTLGYMQAWLANNEGKHWSLWPARNHIQMSGYALISGTNNWIIREEDDGLLISAGGHRVATFSPATDTNAAPQIRDVHYESTNNTFAMWVWSPAPATRAPEVGSVASLSSTPLVFMPYNTVSNSWPATVELNGTNVYYLICAAPESSRLFKVFLETAAATSPTLDVRALSIDGTPLASTLAGKVGIDDLRVVNALTNGGVTINGISLGNGTNLTITGGSGGGGGLSNVVVNGVGGVISGSGSNTITTITLTAPDIGAVSNTPAGIAAAEGVTNGMPQTLTMTNLTTLADGVYGPGTNGVFFTRSGTNYWILLQ
jgi:hypothetical protein